jgi:hypothetical protein
VPIRFGSASTNVGRSRRRKGDQDDMATLGKTLLVFALTLAAVGVLNLVSRR